MLDLKKDIYKKFFVSIIGLFSVVFALAYVLLKELLLTHLNPEAVNVVQVLDSYNTIWAEVIIAFVLFGIIAFLYIKKLHDALLEDIEHLDEYMQEINKKNYDAIIQIQHYTEFLKISLVFKNLVKRLKQREKK